MRRLSVSRPGFREVAGIFDEALQPSFDADALKVRVTALAGKHPLWPRL